MSSLFEVHTSRLRVSVRLVRADDARMAGRLALLATSLPEDRYLCGEPAVEFVIARDPREFGWTPAVVRHFPKRPWRAPSLRYGQFHAARDARGDLFRGQPKKLSPEQQAYIRQELSRSDRSLAQIARETGVSRPMISKLKKRWEATQT